jgi:hypothetical protein
MMGIGNYIPGRGREKELENRVKKLEELVEGLIKIKNPSFQEFKFIKEKEIIRSRPVPPMNRYLNF